MFNLLVSYREDSWDSGVYKVPKERFCEYTDSDIRLRYLDITEDTANELMSYPCLFVVENEAVETRIGYITEITDINREIKIKFKLSSDYKSLPEGAFDELRTSLYMEKFEVSRTHWAIKDVDLFEVLEKNDLLKSLTKSIEKKIEDVSSEKNIFIVHGHDSVFKIEVSDFIKESGLNPIVLHEQGSSGMTIIEKIEHYSSVKFVVVLYSECDVGGKKDMLPVLSYRARQNVVFEHGYLMGKLGRKLVLALIKGEVETPNDTSGIVYVKYSEEGSWKKEMIRELKEQGIEF